MTDMIGLYQNPSNGIPDAKTIDRVYRFCRMTERNMYLQPISSHMNNLTNVIENTRVQNQNQLYVVNGIGLSKEEVNTEHEI